MAPQIDYFMLVFLPVVERVFGVDRVKVTVLQRGFYPKGGGRVRLEVTPLPPGETLKALNLIELGKLTRVHGYVFVGGTLPAHIAWTMHKQAVQDLQRKEQFSGISNLDQNLRVVVEKEAAGEGSGLVLWAESDTGCLLAGSALGERKKKPEDVATEATSMLLESLTCGACVDEYLQDQLIIFMALAGGRSRFISGPLSLHTQTTIWLASEIAGVTFDVKEVEGSRLLIQCHGLGFSFQPEVVHAEGQPG
jgi:RNA 3'-terminal phosphate cyclase (ATP)